MNGQLQQFEQLVGQLLSNDNAIRSQAEQVLNETKKNPDLVFSLLIGLLRGSQHENIKDMSAVLLRRIVTERDSPWKKTTPPTQEVVKSELLKALQEEPLPKVASKICDTVSDLAIDVLGEETKGEWKELLPCLFHLTQSPQDGHRESALNIFSQLVTFLNKYLSQYHQVLKDIFQKGLRDSNLKVRSAAFGAVVNFLTQFDEEDPQVRKGLYHQFNDLVAPMLELLREELSNQKIEEAKTTLQLFVELVGAEPLFLKPHIIGLFNAMMTIATRDELNEELRHTALEFLVTLAEAKPAMARNIPNFVASILPLLLKMMSEVEENEDWNKGEEADCEDDEKAVAEEALDRLAISLKGKTLTGPLFAHLPNLLTSEQWKLRFAALTAVGIIGEGCNKFLIPILKEFIPRFVLPGFHDPHPRVRWATCNTVGQLATDFQGALQHTFHLEILTGLTQIMQNDHANPRVQSHAASAVINFCDDLDPQILDPYLDALVGCLSQLLQKDNKLIQEQAITAIASIADCVEGKFGKFYNDFVPYLKKILYQATSREFSVLRGKAMECISLIGVAVGKERFGQDAKEVMDLLLRTGATLAPDDPQVSFQFQAWTRLCKCLGQDFIPYLPMVMPALIETAKLTPEVKIIDSEELTNPEGWDLFQIGEKNVAIRTSMLDDKSTACNMIFCYCEDLKEGFYPYVDVTTKLMAPMLKFYFDNIRITAANIVPCLLDSTSIHLKNHGMDRANLQVLWNYIYPLLLEAIKEEIELEVLQEMLESLGEAVEVVGENFISPKHLADFADVVKSLVEDYFTRRKQRETDSKDPEYDQDDRDDIEDENEKEKDILTSIAEVIGKFIQTHKEAFIQSFQQLFPAFINMLNPACSPHDRQIALCILDDLVEYSGPAGQQFLPTLTQASIQYVNDQDPSVRQAAVYGVGLCAQFGGEKFLPFISDALHRLHAVIQHPQSREPDNVYATENAISSFGKIVRHQLNGQEQQQQALAAWITFLPITTDKLESKVVYDTLCFFLESPLAQGVIGNQLERLPNLLQIFGQILETELVSNELSIRISAIVKRLQGSLPPAALQSAVTALDEAQKLKLQNSANRV